MCMILRNEKNALILIIAEPLTLKSYKLFLAPKLTFSPIVTILIMKTDATEELSKNVEHDASNLRSSYVHTDNAGLCPSSKFILLS